jgi:hypothetical protein
LIDGVGFVPRRGRRVTGDGRASVNGQELDLLRVKTKEKCQRGRRREGEAIGERRRRGVHWIDGECSNSPRYWMFSGEKFHQPCGDLSEGKEREMEEGSTGFL